MPGSISNEELARVEQIVNQVDSYFGQLMVSITRTINNGTDNILLDTKKIFEQREKLLQGLHKDTYEQWKKLNDRTTKLSKSEINEKKKLEEDLNKYRQQLTTASINAEIRATENKYKQASIAQKREINKQNIESIKQTLSRLQEEQELELSISENTESEKQKIREKYAQEEISLRQTLAKEQSKLDKLASAKYIGRGKDLVGIYQDMQAHSKESLTQRSKDLQQQIAAKKEEYLYAEDEEERKRAAAELNALGREKASNDAMLTVVTAISNTTKKIEENIGQSVDKAMENISKYMPKMDARLQGTGKDYAALSAMVRQNLAVSPFVKQTEVLESLSKLVSAGIVRNLEQRAFLDSVSDKISETFNALNSTLTRLVRLQQYDTTAARLGMREGLTEFFNTQFMDSSYLNDMYDTVSGAIIEANSLLSRDESVAFEYAVQKWLGSLYSLGASESFISDIAKGINYLATGNVQSLAGDNALQNLLAMSAARSGGKGYAQMLKEGLDASDVNTLMVSMVKYLQEIAAGTATNRVVKSAYGGVFGLGVSDFTSISNVANLASIAAQNWGFSEATANAAAQVGGIASRTSISNMIENLFENAFYTIGSHIAENPVLYTLWKVTDLIKSAGGIPLPNLGVLGNFLDLTAYHVDDIMKAGLIGAGSIGLIADIVGNLSNGGNLAFGNWGPVTSKSKGGNGLSKSAYVTSGSSSDIQSQSLTETTEQAQETTAITNKNVKANYSFDDLYDTLFTAGKQMPMQVTVTNSVGVTLDDIRDDEANIIRSYVDERVKDIVAAVIASSFTPESGNSMSVIIKNPIEEPVPISVTNPEITDYYTQAALQPPQVEVL